MMESRCTLNILSDQVTGFDICVGRCCDCMLRCRRARSQLHPPQPKVPSCTMHDICPVESVESAWREARTFCECDWCMA